MMRIDVWIIEHIFEPLLAELSRLTNRKQVISFLLAGCVFVYLLGVVICCIHKYYSFAFVYLVSASLTCSLCYSLTFASPLFYRGLLFMLLRFSCVFWVPSDCYNRYVFDLTTQVLMYCALNFAACRSLPPRRRKDLSPVFSLSRST